MTAFKLEAATRIHAAATEFARVYTSGKKYPVANTKLVLSHGSVFSVVSGQRHGQATLTVDGVKYAIHSGDYTELLKNSKPYDKV